MAKQKLSPSESVESNATKKAPRKPKTAQQQNGDQVCYVRFATNVTWAWTKPEYDNGAVTLVVVQGTGNNALIQLAVIGTVENLQNNFKPYFKAAIYPAAQAAPTINQATVEVSGGANPLSGTVTYNHGATPQHRSPVPSNQKYKVIVWPGERPLVGNPPPPAEFGAPEIREFHITHITQ